MSMNQTETHHHVIREAFDLADLIPVEVSRWGHLQYREDDRIVRVCADDNTFRVYVMTGKAEAIESEVQVSGGLANSTTLAALIRMGYEL